VAGAPSHLRPSMSDKSYNTNLVSEFYVLSALHRFGLRLFARLLNA
jgi:hypothetical protein